MPQEKPRPRRKSVANVPAERRRGLLGSHLMTWRRDIFTPNRVMPELAGLHRMMARLCDAIVSATGNEHWRESAEVLRAAAYLIESPGRVEVVRRPIDDRLDRAPKLDVPDEVLRPAERSVFAGAARGVHQWARKGMAMVREQRTRTDDDRSIESIRGRSRDERRDLSPRAPKR